MHAKLIHQQYNNKRSRPSDALRDCAKIAQTIAVPVTIVQMAALYTSIGSD